MLAPPPTCAHNDQVLTIDSLLSFLKPGNARAILFWLLPVSMLLLLDTYTIIVVSELFGAYLTLAVSATVSLSGVFLSALSLNRHQRLLRRAVFLSGRPDRMYRTIAASFTAGLLFLGPGGATAVLGLLCLLPVFRVVPGYILSRAFRDQLSQVYEYLKMENAGHVSATAQAIVQENDAVPEIRGKSDDAPGSGESD